MMKRQGYYNRLLLSYLPIFFSVFIILVLLILIGSTYLSRETVKKESMVMAKFINSAIDRELKAVEQMMSTELLDKKQFIMLTQLTPTHDMYYSTYELSVMLRNITLKYPLIDSIYIHRYSDQSVQTMNVTSTLQRFGDREFIKNVVGSEGIDASSWSGVREYREFDGQTPEKVVSIVRTIPILREAGGLIVMNVNMDGLLRLTHHLSDPASTYVTVTDAGGEPLVESGPWGVKTDAVYTSAYTGYSIGLGYREGVLNGILNTMVFLYIVIAVIVGFFGLLWMVYITRRNYKPIQGIISRLDRIAADSKLPFEKKHNKDEFIFVEQILEKMIEQATAFEQQHKEHTAIKRRFLFAELREGGFSGAENEALQQLKIYEWDLSSEGFQMAVMEIDGYDGFASRFNERDQSLLKFAMFSVLIEMTHEVHRTSPWLDWVSVSQIAVLYPVRRDDTAMPETLASGLRQAVAWIDNHLKTTVSIGIGSPVWAAKHISASYGEAQHMLKFKFTLGENRVIGYWEIERDDRFSHMGLAASARDLADQFRLAAPDWEIRFDEWFDQMNRLLVPKEEIDMLLRCLIYHIRREVSQLSSEFLEAWNEDYDPAIERCMRRTTMVSEMGQTLREILKAAGARLTEIREANSHAEILRKVRAYIDCHYTDPNLSLTLLSSTFDINSKTLSRLFKEQFGVNFVDYLMKRRIDQAKQLLLESEAPIQHISRKVGYVNALSFTRAFKKMEGITPLELRRA